MFYSKICFIFILSMTTCTLANANNPVKKTKMANPEKCNQINYFSKPWMTPYYQLNGNKIIRDIISISECVKSTDV
jgi:hypothetical protein